MYNSTFYTGATVYVGSHQEGLANDDPTSSKGRLIKQFVSMQPAGQTFGLNAEALAGADAELGAYGETTGVAISTAKADFSMHLDSLTPGVTLTSAAGMSYATTPADADYDGFVSLPDLAVVARNLGQTTGQTQLTGDFNGDGAVNAADVAVARANYGHSDYAGLTMSAAGRFDADYARATAMAASPQPVVVAAGPAYHFATTAGTGVRPRYVSGLTAGDGATAVVDAAAASANRQVVVTADGGLTLAGTFGNWTGLLDLTNNDLVVPGGSLATVTDQAAQGFAGGAWNGSGGLTSSTAAADARHLTAVGVIQNATTLNGSTPIYTVFDGQSVFAADVLARYTVYGDTNLDGTVTAADLTRMDAGAVNHLTGWQNGDVNYDGVVDGSDYALADNAFNQQAGQVAAPAAVAAAAVPEPASVLALAGAAGLFRRRRPSGRLAVRPECA